MSGDLVLQVEDLRTYFNTHISATVIHLLTVIFMLIIVWYLASHLSGMVRVREYELEEKNRCLKDAQEAKTKHMMRVTHELKSPFAAIDANVQKTSNGQADQ